MNTLVEYETANILFTVISKLLKDTVNDAASMNISVLGKVELDELAKTTGVIVVHRLSVPKGLHDRTANKRKQSSQQNLRKGLFLDLTYLLIIVNFYPDAQPKDSLQVLELCTFIWYDNN